jgi:ribonuclease HI
MITMHCDGSCLSPQGPGGWAYRFEFNGRVYKSSGGLKPTTNNQMELMSVIEGLSAAQKVVKEGTRVLAVSDSKYVIRGATEWIENWKRRRWITAEGKPVSNQTLWERLDELGKSFDMRWKWVKGHAGHEMNEIVDEMARDAAILISRAA